MGLRVDSSFASPDKCVTLVTDTWEPMDRFHERRAQKNATQRELCVFLFEIIIFILGARYGAQLFSETPIASFWSTKI